MLAVGTAWLSSVRRYSMSSWTMTSIVSEVRSLSSATSVTRVDPAVRPVITTAVRSFGDDWAVATSSRELITVRMGNLAFMVMVRLAPIGTMRAPPVGAAAAGGGGWG